MNGYLLTDEIIFDSKPDAVPYNYRISYKMSQIALIIGLCCNGRSGCTLVKMHIISNALNVRSYMDDLEKYVNGKTSYILVRFDPAINRVVKYALADGIICQLKNGAFKLTDRGKELVRLIKKDDNLMKQEKEYLTKIGYKLDAEKIERLMSTWRYTNAED